MLADLQTSGSVPRGMIIGFKVIDPRLKYVDAFRTFKRSYDYLDFHQKMRNLNCPARNMCRL